MRLSYIAIRNVKAGKAVQKLPGGEDLCLWVMPTGESSGAAPIVSRGRQKKLAFGAYPAIGLARASAERERAEALLATRNDLRDQLASSLSLGGRRKHRMGCGNYPARFATLFFSKP